jgi:hypothetical protein
MMHGPHSHLASSGLESFLGFENSARLGSCRDQYHINPGVINTILVAVWTPELTASQIVSHP